MKRSPLLLAALLTACGATPRAPEGTQPASGAATGTPPTTPATPPPATTVAPVAPPANPAATRTGKLDNGLTLALTTVPPGHDAIVQFGLNAGTATQAPGLAELTAHALLESADPSRGRASLAMAIGELGGTTRVHAGLTTTWLELRVPGARWPRALQALREALDAPQQSRHQLERVRDAVVAATAAAVAADPLATMANQLLLGSADTAAHCNDLIDRDAAEIGTFLARVVRPDRCLLAVQAPETTDRVLAALQRGAGALGDWKPAAGTGAGSLTTLDRPFQGGVHWLADGGDGPCQVALVTVLPDVARDDAAAMFLLHACVTLDGSGGRFERLQQELGLGGVQWRSEIVQTPDTAALVLRTRATAADAAALWRTWNLARQSLRDVPPTAEELALAARRAPLSARLALLDAGARGRTAARLARAERSLGELDAAFVALATASSPVATALDRYRALPSAMIVTGGSPPADLAEVRRFRLLPSTLTTAATSPAATGAPPDAASAVPWLERAAEAIGGKDRLLRLHGWRSEGRSGNERAPRIGESIEWSDDGSLVRTREVLGQKVTTTLRGTDWTEQMGARTATLTAREAELLRRQQRRHPLALLAAHLRGQLPFRVVSQRNVGDRDLLVLETVGAPDDRLRLHLDAESCLVRAVEVWETLADGTVMHVHEAWSDYRTTQGLRAPFHRLSTLDDGQNRIETALTSWVPRLR